VGTGAAGAHFLRDVFSQGPRPEPSPPPPALRGIARPFPDPPIPPKPVLAGWVGSRQRHDQRSGGGGWGRAPSGRASQARGSQEVKSPLPGVFVRGARRENAPPGEKYFPVAGKNGPSGGMAPQAIPPYRSPRGRLEHSLRSPGRFPFPVFQETDLERARITATSVARDRPGGVPRLGAPVTHPVPFPRCPNQFFLDLPGTRATPP
jgi:hypothetical protein